MERVTDIFEQDTEDSSEDLDIDLANASHVLQKIAEQEGIELDDLSDEDVASLLSELLPPEKTASAHQEPQKEQTMSDETQIPNEITNADVAVELGKIAQAEGIDLNELSREDYHQLFAELAENMSDPSYFEQKVAAEEKIADAREIGRAMAEGFVEKLAELEGGDEDEATKEASRMAAAKDAVRGAIGKVRGAASGAADKVRGAASKARSAASGAAGAVREKEHAVSTRVGYKLRGGAEGAKKRMAAGGNALEDAAKSRRTGRAALGGAALATAGAGAGAAAMRKKQSFDEAFEQDAVAFANHILVENGIVEPTKLAADQTEFSEFSEFAGDDYYAAVYARAEELLQENGYLES